MTVKYPHNINVYRSMSYSQNWMKTNPTGATSGMRTAYSQFTQFNYQ
jgi:hypothetical protein